jgi:hypothetical protein
MAPHRGISQSRLGLRVRNLAMEAPLPLPVSEGYFWCLVFDGSETFSWPCDLASDLARRRIDPGAQVLGGRVHDEVRIAA